MKLSRTETYESENDPTSSAGTRWVVQDWTRVDRVFESGLKD